MFLSLRNLLIRPLTVSIAVLLLALGLGLATALLQLQYQMAAQFERNLAGIDMVLGAKGSPLQMVLCSMYHIDAPTGNIPLSAARPFLNPKHPLIKTAVPLALGDCYLSHRIVGTTTPFLTLYNAKIAQGTLFSKGFEVVAGADAAQRLGLSIGSTFTSEHGLNADSVMMHEGHPFKVVGILEPTGSVADQLLLTTIQSVWDMHEAHHDHPDEAHEISQIQVTESQTSDVNSNTDLLAANPEREITNILIQYRAKNFQTLQMPRNINENTDLQAASPAYEVNKLAYQTGLGFEAMKILAYCIVAVSAFSVLLSLLAALKDRRQELALMRVLGGTRTRMFGLIAAEGFWIALIGSIFGILLGHMAIALIAGHLQTEYRYHITPWLWLAAEGWLIVGALFIGLLAASIPAWMTYRLDISRTLSA